MKTSNRSNTYTYDKNKAKDDLYNNTQYNNKVAENKKNSQMNEVI